MLSNDLNACKKKKKKGRHMFSLAVHPSFDTSKVLCHSSSPKKVAASGYIMLFKRPLTIIDM